MSTLKQRMAYRELQAARLKDAQVKAYGMVPFAARHKGKCGCGKIHSAGEGWGSFVKDTPCGFLTGDKIVKFRGAWWNVSCVDRVKLEEFRATAKYVRVVTFLSRLSGEVRTVEKDWSNDLKDVERWREEIESEATPGREEKVVERG